MATTRTTSTLASLAIAAILGAAWLIAGQEPANGARIRFESQEHEAYEEEGYATADTRRQEPDASKAAFLFESNRRRSVERVGSAMLVLPPSRLSPTGSKRRPAVTRLLENMWSRRARSTPRRVRALASGRRGYGWPVKPFDSQHPIRGYFGDPRIGMTPTGMRCSFHFGIDVSAADGSPVYATLSGRVERWSHRPEVVGIRSDDGHTSFEYWHIQPLVSAGERVVAYKTIVGHIAKGWGHVHFSELHDGGYVNPLRDGAMSPYADTTPPVVKSLRPERNAAGVDSSRLSGSVDLVAEAFDVTPLKVPAPWTDRPVTPATVRWRVRGRPWRPAVDFRSRIPGVEAYDLVYARWTRQNKPWRNGRYRFYLVRGLDTRSLPNGKHVIDVAASDTARNTTVRSFAISVRNGGS